MKQEIKEFLSEISPNWRSRKIIEHPDWVEYIKKKYPTYTLAHAIHYFMNDIERPVCKVCGGQLKLPKHDTCSTRCREELKSNTGAKALSIKKSKETLLKKYNVENIANIPGAQQKRKQTMNEKYGSGMSDKSRRALEARRPDILKKIQKNFIAKAWC